MTRYRMIRSVCCLFLLLYLVIHRGLAWGGPSTPTSTDPTPSAKSAPSPQSQRLYPETLSDLLEDGERAFTIAGIIAAGVWAYFNYFRGRTYRPRLEPNVSGTLSANNEATCLAATIHVKNVGLSKVDIQKRGSALSILVSEVPPGISDVQEIEWKNVAVFDIFEAHQWIEPGELIQEQRLIAIPNRDYLAFRLELRLVSQKKEWNAMTIVPWTRSASTQITGTNHASPS